MSYCHPLIPRASEALTRDPAPVARNGAIGSVSVAEAETSKIQQIIYELLLNPSDSALFHPAGATIGIPVSCYGWRTSLVFQGMVGPADGT